MTVCPQITFNWK